MVLFLSCELANIAIFVILVDDELDYYFVAYMFNSKFLLEIKIRKMDKIYSSVDFADIILFDTSHFTSVGRP
jgi:hypothetical protein